MSDIEITNIEELANAFEEITKETNELTEKMRNLSSKACYIDSRKHRTLRDTYGILELAKEILKLS